jgi:hypothetical protein
MGNPTYPEYIWYVKKLKYKIKDTVVITDINDDNSESVASNIEADEEPKPEANNVDDIEDNTKSNAIEDNTKSNTTENNTDNNIQTNRNDNKYDGTDCMVMISIKSYTALSTMIWAPPSIAS